ncbi:MAG: hypothetical protein ACPGXK_15400, partial [Phycisphaerae bacterium]
GCTQFDETYHVGVYREGAGQPMQFYRFRMKGTADWGTKTKFASAWYPADAIQAVVGEYRPSELIASGQATDGIPSSLSPSDDHEHWVVGPEGARQTLRDQRLVIFMASDPEPVTQAIQSFATNADVQATVGALVTKMRHDSVDQHGSRARTMAKVGLQVLRTVLAGMPDEQVAGKASQDVQKLITNVVQQ